MSFEQLQKPLSDVAEKIRNLTIKEAIILHHNDTDGLSSGAIAYKALMRQGFKVHRYCLEKPYPEIVKKLFLSKQISAGGLIVLSDFGSGMLDDLRAFNKGIYFTLVLDHHGITGSEGDGVAIVNPLKVGLSGDQCSASQLLYEFALSLNDWNQDLDELGTLGAVGDGFIVDAELSKIAKAVDALGSAGYFRGGPDIAVKGLIDSEYDAIFQLAKPFQDEMNQKFKVAGESIKKNITSNVTWVMLDKSFEDFGVKTVGLFCQYLRDNKLVAETKYIAGFQLVPKVIPGLGHLESDITKVSMRVPATLKKQIEAGQKPALTEILPEATRKLGGFVDACHPLAAATTIPTGMEEALINEIEKILS